MLTIEEFRAEAHAWFAAHLAPRPQDDGNVVWGEGSDSVALFHNLSAAEEKALIDTQRAWVQQKADAGFANVSWEPEWGGRGLPLAYERALLEEESRFVAPPSHEAVSITIQLIGNTLRAVGTEAQKQRFLRRTIRTEDLWCQLFSEPGAGSDLAAAATSAVRIPDGWVLNGQKVWTSGAQYADWGYILCRTDPDAPKHRGLTAFIVPMTAPGVEIRPLRQMTGGSSFNEVFFTDVLVPDDYRLGAVGDGWRVAVTTLGFERGGAGGRGGVVPRLMALARHRGRQDDPVIRQLIAKAYTHEKLLGLTIERAKSRLRAGETPGPEGSIGKLYWTEGLRLNNEVAAALLGPELIADTGEWGTYAWSELLLGTAGFRVAAGTDEVQRNILSERVLGLPGEPRVDRDVAFRDVPRGPLAPAGR